MKACTICLSTFEDSVRFCPFHGIRLVALPALSLSPGDEFSGFNLLSKVGQDGLGEIFHAQRDDAQYRLRVFSPNVVSERGKEERLIALLKTATGFKENCVRIDEFQRVSEKIIYSAQAFVQGKSLRDIQKTIGTFDEQETAHLIYAILQSLENLHASGLAHGGLNLKNIIISPDATIKIHDATLWSLFRDEQYDEVLTENSDILDSIIDTMAPELAQSTEAHAYSDIYSVAALAIQLLTGKSVFSADTSKEKLEKKLNHDSLPLAELGTRLKISADFQDILSAACNKEHELRFQSTRAFCAALESCFPNIDESSGGKLNIRIFEKVRPLINEDLAKEKHFAVSKPHDESFTFHPSIEGLENDKTHDDMAAFSASSWSFLDSASTELFPSATTDIDIEALKIEPTPEDSHQDSHVNELAITQEIASPSKELSKEIENNEEGDKDKSTTREEEREEEFDTILTLEPLGEESEEPVNVLEDSSSIIINQNPSKQNKRINKRNKQKSEENKENPEKTNDGFGQLDEASLLILASKIKKSGIHQLIMPEKKHRKVEPSNEIVTSDVPILALIDPDTAPDFDQAPAHLKYEENDKQPAAVVSVPVDMSEFEETPEDEDESDEKNNWDDLEQWFEKKTHSSKKRKIKALPVIIAILCVILLVLLFSYFQLNKNNKTSEPYETVVADFYKSLEETSPDGRVKTVNLLKHLKKLPKERYETLKKDFNHSLTTQIQELQAATPTHENYLDILDLRAYQMSSEQSVNGCVDEVLAENSLVAKSRCYILQASAISTIAALQSSDLFHSFADTKNASLVWNEIEQLYKHLGEFNEPQEMDDLESNSIRAANEREFFSRKLKQTTEEDVTLLAKVELFENPRQGEALEQSAEDENQEVGLIEETQLAENTLEIAAQPEPVAVKPEPVVAKPEPVAAKPEPAAAKPEPVAAKPEPVAAKPEPVVAKPEPVVAKPEPVVAKPEPAVAKPEPAAAKPEPAAAKPEPVQAKTESEVPTGKLLADALAAMSKNDFEEAKKLLNQAKRQDSKNSRVWDISAKMNEKQNNIQDAVSDCKKACDLSKSASCYIYLGDLFAKAKQSSDALAAYQKAIAAGGNADSINKKIDRLASAP